MRNIVYTVTEWLRGDATEYSARCIYGPTSDRRDAERVAESIRSASMDARVNAVDADDD